GLDAGVVDQDIQPSQLCDALAHQALAVFHAGDIGGDDARATPERTHLRRTLVGIGVVCTTVDDDIGALLGQPHGDTAADSLGAAGDQRDLVLQSHVHLRYQHLSLEVLTEAAAACSPRGARNGAEQTSASVTAGFLASRQRRTIARFSAPPRRTPWQPPTCAKATCWGSSPSASGACSRSTSNRSSSSTRWRSSPSGRSGRRCSAPSPC